MKRLIYFAGGCFWGVQHFFDQISGVLSTQCGYSNGKDTNVTYELVKSQVTGCAETVKVEYDNSKIKLETLVKAFIRVIDPYELNHQGPDYGTQYRTGIYYESEEDKKVIKKIIVEFEKKYNKKTVVEIEKVNNFIKAEEFHQKYFVSHPNEHCHIDVQYINQAKDINDKSFENE